MHALGIMIEEARIHDVDEMEVEHVEPHHRPVAEIAMVVPGHRRRDDEIAGCHHRPLAADCGIGVLALDDEAQRRRGVTMGGRDLAGEDDLEPAEQAVRDPLLAAQTGIFEDENAALGLLGGDDLARLHEVGADLVVFPHRRLHRRHRLRRHHARQVNPERRQVLRAGAVVERLARGVRLDCRVGRVHGSRLLAVTIGPSPAGCQGGGISPPGRGA